MKISGAESLVMEALWRQSPLTAEEVAAAVGPGQNWSTVTVKTLLNRLLTKKAVAAQRDGRRYLYAPLIARADYVQEESKSLIDRLFDGKLAPLVSHFAETDQLSADDIAQLKRLIEDLSKMAHELLDFLRANLAACAAIAFALTLVLKGLIEEIDDGA